MALSLVAMTAPNAVVRHSSGRTYQASANGQVVIPATDAAQFQTDTLQVNFQVLRVQVPSGMTPAPLIPIFWSGLTADRPGSTPQGTGGFTLPPPALGLAFQDTTLSTVIYFVGSIASTRWTDSTGAAV